MAAFSSLLRASFVRESRRRLGELEVIREAGVVFVPNFLRVRHILIGARVSE
jgi:hypothetical protein